ncbi:MAG: preprotein translocase subunit YajC [Puniceicoccales bacterium]|jgi:preprotein translocase subunit YajC|nr:preprotein translocase subunit YajC [Puniceicoccales bacterium]
MSFVFNPIIAQATDSAAAPSTQTAPSVEGAAPGSTVQSTTTVPPPAPPVPQRAQSTTDVIFSIGPFALMIIAFWFLLIRPQQKKQKEIAQRQAQLKTGDQVLTSAGIYGKVVTLDADRITLQVGEGTRIQFQRQAIVGFVDETKQH